MFFFALWEKFRAPRLHILFRCCSVAKAAAFGIHMMYIVNFRADLGIFLDGKSWLVELKDCKLCTSFSDNIQSLMPCRSCCCNGRMWLRIMSLNESSRPLPLPRLLPRKST
ncbi:hypothetical protein BJ878DRAFT_507171 [Calycina marina]|uniref:Uncharacterized protein n=1 Tax=Calycina marina TaxID=1763456 RepID=A0A9P8CEX4_9HELO|nr:hypothetical protein BJ878DRAFT_507171 [Calycina marina]